MAIDPLARGGATQAAAYRMGVEARIHNSAQPKMTEPK